MVSCAKKKAPETPFTRIQGKWKLVRYANDDNGNGQIENMEIHAQQSGITYKLEFKGDATGTETTFISVNQSESPLPFVWRIINPDSVRLDLTGHLTITYKIAEVSDAFLTLKTNSSLGLAAYYYDAE